MKYVAAISTATAIKHKSRQSATAPPATMADTCVDGPGVDSYGTGCEWYDNVPEGCGYYDTYTFSAFDACCACGAVSYVQPEPTPDVPDDPDYCAEILDL